MQVIRNFNTVKVNSFTVIDWSKRVAVKFDESDLDESMTEIKGLGSDFIALLRDELVDRGSYTDTYSMYYEDDKDDFKFSVHPHIGLDPITEVDAFDIELLIKHVSK